MDGGMNILHQDIGACEACGTGRYERHIDASKPSIHSFICPACGHREDIPQLCTAWGKYPATFDSKAVPA
jgi:hypothetical protein